MNINELKSGNRCDILEASVVKMENVREINKYGKLLRVADVTIKDKTGSIILILWNDQINKVSIGKKVKIENGYVNEWQNKPQLTLGRFGKITVS